MSSFKSCFLFCTSSVFKLKHSYNRYALLLTSFERGKHLSLVSNSLGVLDSRLTAPRQGNAIHKKESSACVFSHLLDRTYNNHSSAHLKPSYNFDFTKTSNCASFFSSSARFLPQEKCDSSAKTKNIEKLSMSPDSATPKKPKTPTFFSSSCSSVSSALLSCSHPFNKLSFLLWFAGSLTFFGYVYSCSLEKNMTLKEYSKHMLSQLEEYISALTDKMNDFTFKYFPDSNEPLLPDFQDLKYPDYLPTLVIDLDKTVVHLEHERHSGWRVLKRPGADRFFRELVNYYEIVIWSDDNYPVAQEVMAKWGVPVIGCIHRDQCRNRRGVFVKDLSRLGRRMDRTIIIDHDSNAFMLQPENGIKIREYNGDTEDRELEDLIDLLKAIATSFDDVRTQLKNYGGGDVDIGRRFLVQKTEQEKKSESRRYLGKAFGVGKSQKNLTFNSSFGGSTSTTFNR